MQELLSEIRGPNEFKLEQEKGRIPFSIASLGVISQCRTFSFLDLEGPKIEVQVTGFNHV